MVMALSSLSVEPPPLYGALRADPRTKDIPLILITGRGDLTIRRRLGEKPPYVLFKPFQLDALVQTVTQAIEAA
jgi:CheY-like chemotaxis protein